MLRKRLPMSVFAVLLALSALSCAPDSKDSILGPGTTQIERQADAQFDSASHAAQAEMVPLDQAQILAQGYTLITEPAPKPVRSLFGWIVRTVDATLALLIGSDGGLLSLLGHAISVPQGAVLEPTIFSMTVIQQGHVEVELTATPKSLLSKLFFWRSVEEVQFQVPVDLTLSYARATNVTDPSRLKILRINPDGRHEVMPSTVDPVTKTVTAELDHFSRYCMVAD